MTELELTTILEEIANSTYPDVHDALPTIAAGLLERFVLSPVQRDEP